MSIVPYNSDRNNKIVYHDLTHQIVVVHNHEDNSFSLYNDINGLDIRRPRGSSPSMVEPDLTEILCPNCGVDLLDFLSQGNSSKFRRRHSSKSRSRKASTREENSVVALAELAITEWPTRFSPPSSIGLSPVEFMHRDYFKLLANINVNTGALGAPGDEVSSEYSNDLFNHGYFKRFFRKIPPGILGSGARAQVYKVVHVLKDIKLGVFAVKRINVGDHSKFLNHVLNEVLILYELSVKGANEHNLIRYNHVWMETGDLSDLSTILLGQEGAPSQTNKTEVPYVYILQQYCDGGHLEYMMMSNFQREMTMLMKEKLDAERARRRNRKLLDPSPVSEERKRWLLEVEIWKFFHDIANGVLYLHSHGILHRDLKPSNCLLESKYDSKTIPKGLVFESMSELDVNLLRLPRVLVSDFGEGKFIDKQSIEAHFPFEERRGNTGTVEFTDPRLWVYALYTLARKGKRKFAHNFTYDCDIYSLGMILCYLCVGTLPFAQALTNTNDPEAVRQDITTWHDNLTDKSFNEWFNSCVKLVNDHPSEATVDFGLLIYMMIKGEDNVSKPSATYVLDYLQLMKEKRFLQGHDAVEEDARSVNDAGSSDAESLSIHADDTINLFKYQNTDDVHTTYVINDGSNLAHICVCLVSLVSLELTDWPSALYYVKFVKLCSLLSLVIGTQVRVHRPFLSIITALSTVSAIVYSLHGHDSYHWPPVI